jgi:hypothetical protein
MRFLAAVLVATLSAACTTNEGKPRLTLVTTEPAGALVQIEGFGECVSPCTIEHDAPRSLTIAKAGYDAVRLTITPGQKEARIVLQLAAPTIDVDETKLPDL